MKLFISQPMRDKTDKEIEDERNKIVSYVEALFGEVEVLDTFFKGVPHDATPLCYLGKSIQKLGEADIAYFTDGWKNYRGCIIEHECCVQYGIKIVHD